MTKKGQQTGAEALQNNPLNTMIEAPQHDALSQEPLNECLGNGPCVSLPASATLAA